MADTVTSRQIFDGMRYVEYEFTNKSDGTGESAVQKIDISTLVGQDGKSGSTTNNNVQSLTFVSGDWEVNGFNHISILWDRTSADELVTLISDSGGVDLFATGGATEADTAAAGTGDILLTTDGGASGSSYRIRLMFRKKYA